MGDRRPAARAEVLPPIVARRRELLERLAEWTPPPAVGAVPEVMLDPALIMLWGVTTQRVHEWARNQEGGAELTGTAASPGIVEGVARVVKTVREIGDVREGEILVCSITSPAWAPIFSKILPRSPTSAASCPTRRSSAGSTGCLRSSAPAARPRRSRRDSESASTAPRNGDDPRVSGADHTRRSRSCVTPDSASFGGKSSTLGELIAAGIPVPPGFAVSTSAFRAFVEEAGLAGMIAGEMSRVSPDDVDSVGAASQAISEAMRSAPVPDAVRDEVARGYAELGGEPPVAVRSSALGEDGQEATFAGQQETYLWVRGADHVCDAVRDCWVSLYSAPAIEVSRPARAATTKPAMGVAVQLMVDAEVSGVLFTCNPVSGDPSMVAVNASWGLGLAVVGGEVTPDDYLVSKVTREVVREHVHAKDIEYVPDAAVAAPSVSTCRRSDEGSLPRPAGPRRARGLGRRIERYFGSHQDVEWAIARGGELPGRLFIVQSRPVTALPQQRRAPSARIGDGPRDELFGVRDREGSDGAERRRRPRDPADHRRVRARRARIETEGFRSTSCGWCGRRRAAGPNGPATERSRSGLRRRDPEGRIHDRGADARHFYRAPAPASRRSSRSARASSPTRSSASSR